MALAILGVVYPIDLSNAATPPRVLADQHDRYGREHRSLRETAKYLPWRVWRCRKTLTAAAFFPRGGKYTCSIAPVSGFAWITFQSQDTPSSRSAYY